MRLHVVLRDASTVAVHAPKVVLRVCELLRGHLFRQLPTGSHLNWKLTVTVMITGTGTPFSIVGV